MERIHNYSEQLIQYLEEYFAHVREGFIDIVRLIEFDEEAPVSNAFIITAMILTPLFGTFLFLTALLVRL